MSGELGKASLDIEANLGPFERNLEAAHGGADRLEHALDALAAVADVCQKALNDVKIDRGQAATSRVSAEQILSGVHGISDESRTAARELDKVKLGSEQVTETEAAGDLIDHKLDEIKDSAERTQRALDGVRLRLAANAGGGRGGRPGYGVGPFGAGYGRLGLVGTAVGLGVATGPAAGPAALGLLAGLPALATIGAGALGTLMLAFDGVTKAIGGDKKAFEDLSKPAQQFVLTVRSLDGIFDKLRKTAAGALFPGLTAGLKAALSPGTVSAVFSAVTQLGKALGSVGAEFGRYFGSGEFQKIFGPLMESAARNIRVLGDGALHLFDALGVLGRAAIPFVNWLTSALDKGAKLADSWIHAKDASGALASAMDKAKSSLTLVAKLAGALIGVVVQLGKALYPISSVILKDLIAGLDVLGKAIGKAAPDIRGALGGALGVLVAVVKVAGPAIGTLADVLLKLVGVAGRALVPVIHALQPLFNALQQVFKELEPPLAKIIRDLGGILAPVVKALAPALAQTVRLLGPLLAGALKVLDPLLRGLGFVLVYVAKAFAYVLTISNDVWLGIERHWRSLGGFFVNLGHAIIHALEYAWYAIEKGALYAALKVVEPFSHLPSFLGGWARKAKDSMQAQLDALQPPNMAWGGYAEKAGAYDGAAWKKGFLGGIAGLIQNAYAGVGAAVHAYAKHHRHHHKPPGLPPVPSPGDPFGKQPPFTKNTGGSGSASAIPLSVQRLDALAARQDQAAAALNYRGKKARADLDREIADLQKADTILEEKLKHAHGKKRLALYKALTANMKKIAEARKRLGEAITKSRQDELNFALDQAKLAVENATQGSKAWDKAIAAEEKALRAEIRYWDRRAHNDKLSAAARDAALRKELSYEKQLKALLNETAQAANANEAQFLSSFVDIQNTFGPNALPVPPGTPGGSGQTDTHLHDIKNEARQQTKHLKAIRDQGKFPGSAASQSAAMAVN